MQRKTERQKLVLIDGNHLLNRNFHIPKFKPLGIDVDGTFVPTGAAYGFVLSMKKIFDDFMNPGDEIIVVWDSGGHNFRKDIDPNYKANREKNSSEFISQYDLAKSFLHALGVTQCWEVGEEADDIIGIMSTSAAADDWYVLIISGDKDFYQLVTENVHVLRPKMGDTPELLVTPEVVFEKFGVTPEMFLELKALMGDGSDNIGGLPGIGPKTGVQILNANGKVADIIKKDAHFIHDSKGKLKPLPAEKQKIINDHKESLAKDRLLVEIKKTANFKLNVRRTEFDANLFKTLCESYRFNEILAMYDRYCETFGWNG